MLRYATSLLLFLTTLVAAAQEPLTATVSDSLTIKKTYGLRVGIDAASLMRTALEDNYTGFQAMADYRLDRRWYAAGEIGTENVDQFNERIDATTTGSFLKLGADYNFYQNWLEMDNMIYAGMRIGYTTYSQELTRYDYYQDNSYFPIPTSEVNEEFNGLNAVWLEFQLGIKVEVLTNLYLGLNVQLKRTVTQGQPERFTNLYIPGFGRTYDTSNIGVGYSYGISYRIPLYKR